MTDYKKLMELCPEIDRADEELRKALPSYSKQVRERWITADSAGQKAVEGALEAQPELLEASHRATERVERERGSDASINESIDVKAAALDQLRKVCRTPTS
jgi:hypothetical protein